MKKISLIITCIISTSFFSCKKDDVVTCITCSSSETLSFEVCKEGDGNASVNGQNTGTSYDTYMSDLKESGAECGRN